MGRHKLQSSSQQDDKTESTCVHVAFCLCALLIYGTFIILLSGAQDILAGTKIQTSTVLLADVGSYFVIPLVFPFFAKKVPYVVRYVTVVLSFLTAFLSLALVNSVYWKLAAICLASFGAGLADVSFIGLTSYFNPSVLSWYSTGTGLGFGIAPLYYTAMTTWLCVSPNVTLLLIGPFSLIFLLCYYFIQKEITENDLQPVMNKSDVVYSKLETLDSETDDSEVDTEQKKLVHKFDSQDVLTWEEKFSAFKKLIALIGAPWFIAFTAEYLFFQSVVTTIAYPNSPFPPRDHYQYYSLALMTGEVLGRSNRSILEILKPDWLYRPTTLSLWILAAIEVFHLLLFLCESWFRFFTGVGFMFMFCFSAGVLIGITYANGLEVVHTSSEGNERELILTMSLLPSNFGTFSASLIGLLVEPVLLKHCISYVKDSRYCFTRPESLISVIKSCKGRL